MINFFNFLYRVAHNNLQFLEKSRINSAMRYIIRVFANKMLPFYFKVFKSNLNEKVVDEKIIISLTTFPLRIDKVWLVIESLLRQTKLPERIILWLSIEQFPKKKRSLPKNLLKLLDDFDIFNIRFVSGDIKSHKKYLYTLIEYPKHILITVDDDIIYPTDMIETLVDFHKKYPKSIICRYSYYMKRDNLGGLIPYNEWVKVKEKTQPRNDIFFGSGGGTLFPVKSLYEDFNNIFLIKKLSFYADDVWLNYMAKLNNTLVVNALNYSSYIPVINKKNETLSSINTGEKSLNDIQINKLQKFYKKTL